MPSQSKRNSNRPSPTPHIKHRFTRLKRQQLYKIPGIRSSLKRSKMSSPLIPFKRIISPMPSGLQTHPFAIPIRSKQLRTNQIISHGPSPSQQKSDSSQKKSRNQHISEKEPFQRQTALTAKAGRSEATAKGQNPTEVTLCGSPGEGKYIRSIASSARAGEHLMCSPCESGLFEQATLYICPPRGSSPESLG